MSMFHQVWQQAVVLASDAQSGPTTPTSLDPAELVQYLLQYGPLGIVLICILFRKGLVPEWTLRQTEEAGRQREEDLANRLGETQEQLEKLQDVFQDQMIPALTRATEVNARYTEELQRARYNRRRDDDPGEPDGVHR